MQLRDQKHELGHPFLINSSLLPSGTCVYEYADGSMKLCKLYEGGTLLIDFVPEDVRADALKNLELAKKLANPNCYNCAFKGSVPGSAHIACNSNTARVEGDEHGIKNGWFLWPFNFDPCWLKDCSGYLPNELVEELKQKEAYDKKRDDGVV